tara:strand:- start:2 stop:418 length:417 start_codon:yes stop_codon:yes gene_type:complete
MENATKIVTLASFVVKDKVDSFKNYLNKRFRIPEDKIFSYFTEDEEDKEILTFRLYLKEGKKINTKSFFPTTIIVHKKGECFYTINALNKLIESKVDLDKGNINYKEYKVDWDEQQGKMLITKDNNLSIMDIKRNFSE